MRRGLTVVPVALLALALAAPVTASQPRVALPAGEGAPPWSGTDSAWFTGEGGLVHASAQHRAVTERTADRSYAADVQETADWVVLAGCTNIRIFSRAALEGTAPRDASPYGWDVTVAATGGPERPVTPTSDTGFTTFPFWELLGLQAGTEHVVRFTPRDGYGAEEQAVTVTTGSGCPEAPQVEVVDRMRSYVTLNLTTAAPSLARTVYAVGDGQEDYPAPILLSSVPGEQPAGVFAMTVSLPPDTDHRLGVSVANADGESLMTEVTVRSTGDVRGLARIAGADRFATAAELAAASLHVEQDTIVVANGLDFPDALAAANLGGPVVLVTPDTLPGPTREFLADMAPRLVIVAGGRSAIGDGVMEEIRAAADGAEVRRVGGADRYETAALLLDVSRDPEPTDAVFAVLASGEGFPDALAAGALAAASPMALMLTGRDHLPPATEQRLRESGVEFVVIAGGTAAVSSGVEAEVRRVLPDARLFRLSGPDRTTTATALAEFGYGLGVFRQGPMVLARGDGFADALAASAVAGQRLAPVMLTATPTVLGPGVPALLEELGCTVEQTLVAGGESAVSGPVAESTTGACDPTEADLRALGNFARAVLKPMAQRLSQLDEGRRPPGSLDILLGIGTAREGHVYTIFDHEGQHVGALQALFAPLALGGVVDDGDGAVPADAPLTLWLDRNRNGACDEGEREVTFTLGSEEILDSRVC